MTARDASILIALSAVLAIVAPGQGSRPESRMPALEACDLVVRGAQIFDGTGAAPIVGDVAVRGERIVGVGDLRDVSAPLVVDGAGLAIAPGFIDVHAHVDYEILANPTADNFLQMGVTTIISGNCGTSVEKIGEHLAALEKQGVGINYGTLIGHGTVRTLVMQSVRRAPKTAELIRMADLVAQGMIDGAFGIATGLIYVPGTYAESDELVEMAKVVGFHGGLYVSHVRDEGRNLDAALDEMFTIAKEAKVPVHVSHLKRMGKATWGSAAQTLRKIEAARARGVRITADQYAYEAASTSIDVLFETATLDVGRRAFGDKLAADAAFRADVEKQVLAKAKASGFDDLAYAVIAAAPNHPELNGLDLARAAERLFGSKARDAQARAATELMIQAKGSRVGMVYHGMNDADVRTIMKAPWVAVAADAGIVGADGSKPHPRGSGNNPRVLGRYARDGGVISLAEAVRKMTSLPATIFGIKDRGTIRTGAFADLVVFDPATINDRATYEDPLAAPVGIRLVIVNGTIAVENGRHRRLRPGAVLRRGR